MSVLWLAVLALGVAPGEASSASTDASPVVEQAAAPLRQGAELGKAVDEALRRCAKASDADASQSARELLALYGELQNDQKMTRAVREQRIGRVRARLSKFAVQLRKEGDSAPAPAPAHDAHKPQIMAQFGGGANQGFGGGFGGQGFGQGAAAQGQLNDDNGQELADVIQKTISPPSWETNGGLGSIYYWRTGRAMVIRQRQEVHEQIVDLIEQLERAN